MSDEFSRSVNTLSLNEIIGLSSIANAKVLSEHLVRQHLAGLINGNCPAGYCDCHGGYCSCKGSVDKGFDPGANEVINPVILERLRNERIEELKAQLAQLEGKK
jgi:hypothetical protein